MDRALTCGFPLCFFRCRSLCEVQHTACEDNIPLPLAETMLYLHILAFCSILYGERIPCLNLPCKVSYFQFIALLYGIIVSGICECKRKYAEVYKVILMYPGKALCKAAFAFSWNLASMAEKTDSEYFGTLLLYLSHVPAGVMWSVVILSPSFISTLPSTPP